MAANGCSTDASNPSDVTVELEGGDGETVPADSIRDVDAANNAGVLGILTCRRRAAASGLAYAYRCLILAGRGLPVEEQEKLKTMAWWSEATSKAGNRVFVFAPRGEGEEDDVEGYIDMWKILSYATSEMHEHVVMQNKKFAVVWIQLNDHRISMGQYWSFKRKLHEHFGKNLEAIHVVHPSWTMRLLCLSWIPLANDDFWNKFFVHERVEFLDDFVDLKALSLPSYVQDHDRGLDNMDELNIPAPEVAAVTGAYPIGSSADAALSDDR